MSYGITKAGKGYRALIPALNKSDNPISKTFTPLRWNNPRSAANLWQDRIGRIVWGRSRWDLIRQGGSLTRMRSPSFGVNIYKTFSRSKENPDIKYEIICVFWRIGKERHQKFFSVKWFGSIEQAEHHAGIFAAHKRAKLTGGVLNLPHFDSWS